MREIFEQINKLSFERLLLDCDAGFPVLRQIPDSNVMIFLEYVDTVPIDEQRALVSELFTYRQFAEPLFYGATVDRSVPVPAIFRFEAAYKIMFRCWRFKSAPEKNFLIQRAIKRGRLSARSTCSGDNLSIEDIKGMTLISVPTGKDILQALKRHFNVEKVKSRASSDYRYRISQMESSYLYETYFTRVQKMNLNIIHHQISAMDRPDSHVFQLFEHTLSAGPANWNMIDINSLNANVLTIKTIVEVFETLAEQVEA